MATVEELEQRYDAVFVGGAPQKRTSPGVLALHPERRVITEDRQFYTVWEVADVKGERTVVTVVEISKNG
jgi:hypothetical protein